MYKVCLVDPSMVAGSGGGDGTAADKVVGEEEEVEEAASVVDMFGDGDDGGDY